MALSDQDQSENQFPAGGVQFYLTLSVSIVYDPGRIRTSRFTSPPGGPASLEFVVERKLEAQLKERTIGVEIFGRPSDYETSADPIVRVKATEIRKRLAQHY